MKQIAFIAFLTRSSSMETSAREPINPTPFFLSERLRFTFTANVNLYHVTKFSPYFSFTVYCFYTKISSFMPVFSTRIVLDCFYLLIFYFEKFSTEVCRMP